MNITIDFVALMNGIILLLIGIGVRFLAKLNEQIRLQNGRISYVEGWKSEHERTQAEILIWLRREIEEIKNKDRYGQ